MSRMTLKTRLLEWRAGTRWLLLAGPRGPAPSAEVRMPMQRGRNSMGRSRHSMGRHSCATANAGPAKATPAVRTWLRIEDTGESSVLQAVRGPVVDC